MLFGTLQLKKAYTTNMISTNICYYDKSYEINKKSWIRYEE
jgi:hypothetical protein